MLRKLFVPGALVLLLVVAVVLVIVAGGDPDVTPPDRNPKRPGFPAPTAAALPDWLPERVRAELSVCLPKVRESLGSDSGAVRGLTSALLLLDERLDEALLTFRPELDLALRADDPESGRAVLQFLGAALKRGSAVADLVRSPGWREVHRRALESPAPDLRIEGIRFLGRLGGPEARSQAVRLLADSDAGVRSAAVALYARDAGAGGAARLAACHAEEEAVVVRVEILRALSENRKFRRLPAWELERKVLAAGADAERIQVLQSVSLHRDHDVLEAILPLLAAESRSVREHAIRTLLILRDRRAIDALEERAEAEEVEELRELAEMALRTIRG